MWTRRMSVSDPPVRDIPSWFTFLEPAISAGEASALSDFTISTCYALELCLPL